MIVYGTVQNGVVVPIDAAQLPADGIAVAIIPKTIEKSLERIEEPQQSFEELMGEFLMCVEGLPEDYALNHEHYRNGTPKR